MKCFITAMFAVLLSGCVFQNTSGYEMKLAYKACEEYGGVYKTTSYFTGGFDVSCNDRIKDQIGSPRVSFSKDRIERQILSKQL